MTSQVAFVAGATGFVGRELVPQLVRRGVKTVAHVRPDSSSLDRFNKRFIADGAVVDTTPWEVAALTATFDRIAVTHIFCVIGTTKKRARGEDVSGDPYQQVDRRLTELLVGAATASATKPRLVLLSSIGANPTARSKYLRARGQADAAVMGSGLAYRIARPSFISGPGRDDGRAIERVGAAVATGVFSVMGALGARKLRDRYAAITPTILAHGLIELGFDDGGDRVVTTENLRGDA